METKEMLTENSAAISLSRLPCRCCPYFCLINRVLLIVVCFIGVREVVAETGVTRPVPAFLPVVAAGVSRSALSPWGPWDQWCAHQRCPEPSSDGCTQRGLPAPKTGNSYPSGQRSA